MLFVLTLQRSLVTFISLISHIIWISLHINVCKFTYPRIQLNYSTSNVLRLPPYLFADSVAYSHFIGNYTLTLHSICACKLYLQCTQLNIKVCRTRTKTKVKVNMGVWAKLLTYDPSLVCFNKKKKDRNVGNFKKNYSQLQTEECQMQCETWGSESKVGAYLPIQGKRKKII